MYETELFVIGAVSLVIFTIVVMAYWSWKKTHEMKQLIACDVHTIIKQSWRRPTGLLLVVLIMPPIFIMNFFFMQLYVQSIVPSITIADPNLLVLGLAVFLVSAIALVFMQRYRLVSTFARRDHIDGNIRSPLLEQREPVLLTNLQRFPIDITRGVLEEAKRRAEFQRPSKPETIKRLSEWLDAFDEGKKIFGHLLVKYKPKLMFGICTGVKTWDEAYDGVDDEIPTEWFNIPVKTGLMSLFDTGVHKVIAPDEVAKKIGVTSMNLNVFGIEDEAAIEAAPLVAFGYDQSFAAVYQQRAFAAEAENRDWEKRYRKLQRDKQKQGIIERHGDLVKTGDAPKARLRDSITPYMKWIILAAIILISIPVGIWAWRTIFVGF